MCATCPFSFISITVKHITVRGLFVWALWACTKVQRGNWLNAANMKNYHGMILLLSSATFRKLFFLNFPSRTLRQLWPGFLVLTVWHVQEQTHHMSASSEWTVWFTAFCDWLSLIGLVRWVRFSVYHQHTCTNMSIIPGVWWTDCIG